MARDHDPFASDRQIVVLAPTGSERGGRVLDHGRSLDHVPDAGTLPPMSVNSIGATPSLLGGAEATRYRYVPVVVGLVLVAIAFAIYFLSNRLFNAGRGDFFYLADAFLHGRTWIDHELGPWDDVIVGSRVYVPFAPFPALAFMPLVAIVGPATADSWQPIINAGLAAVDVGLCWVLMGRVGVRSLVNR